MLFGLGPVIRYELITTARRGRYYAARVLYGLLLLFLLWDQYQNWESELRQWERFHPGGDTAEQVRRFAEAAFIQFAGTQGLALLCLIPALVAGVIADEHQRKTLHYLLASRLSSAEIVLGKLGARLVHVGTFVALGLPVVCLLALYGGLNPQNVFYAYLGTFTLVLFVAGLSILVSILARRPRDAILAAYGLEAAWLMGPHAIAPFAHELRGPLVWVGPVNDVMMLSNPLEVWSRLTRVSSALQSASVFPTWLFNEFEGMFYWMAGLQMGFGVSFLVLAVAGLRPLRGSSWPGAKPRTGWWTRLAGKARAIAQHRAAASLARNEILASRSHRAACGDDPMLWKERHTRIGGGLKWLGGRPMVLFFGVLLGCYVFDVAYPVLAAMAGGRWDFRARPAVNAALRESSVALAILGTLAVAAAAAVSLTAEREQDTWVSLATTLLTPGEVIRAKQFGAVWSARRIGLALAVIWTTGILLGAIHPLGVLAAATLSALAAWLIASLGVFVSCRAKNSTRALMTTFIALFLFLSFSPWSSMLWGSLFPIGGVADPRSGRDPAAPEAWDLTVGTLTFFALVMVLHAAVATGLTSWSIRRLRATWGRA